MYSGPVLGAAFPPIGRGEGAAYLVVAWLVIQIAESLFPLFGFDETPARIVVILVAIGLIPALVLSWAFELTPEGLKRTHEVDHSVSITPSTGKKLDRMIMVVLVLALGYFAFDKFVLDPRRDAELEGQKAVEVEQARLEGRSEALVESYGDQSIAVLADAALAEVIESGQLPLSIAEVFAVRRMNEEAFAWIEKAVASGSFEVAEIHVNPRLSNLRPDPRWAQLMQRLGKSPAQLGAIEFELSLPER